MVAVGEAGDLFLACMAAKRVAAPIHVHCHAFPLCIPLAGSRTLKFTEKLRTRHCKNAPPDLHGIGPKLFCIPESLLRQQ